MSNTILITGISGYIASHIALQLLEKNYRVLGTIRDLEKSNQVKTGLAKHTSKIENLSLIQADLLDPYDKWEEIVKKVDYVMHIASPFPSKPPKTDEEIVKPACQSTLNILQASTKNKIQKVVLTSSTVSCMYGVRKTGLFDETNWTDPTNLKDTSAYTRSKTLAEKAAWDFINRSPDAVRFSSVLPGFVLGPSLLNSSGTSISVIKAILNGQYPAVPKIGFPSVDVRSIADLHIKVLFSKESDGQRFCGVDSYLTFLDIAKILKEKYPDKKIPTVTLPNFIVRTLAVFDSTLKPILADLDSHRQVSSQKAKNMLNWESIDMKTSILETVENILNND